MNYLSSLFGFALDHSNHSILFVLKKPQKDECLYNPYHEPSSGLINSARFVCNMLKQNNVKANIIQVVDSNDIDREVVKHNPDIVILEAIWCPPYKLVELTKLHHHKHRRWIVRSHSKIPFLAMEGQVLDWILTYPTIPRVHVACNSLIAVEEIKSLLKNVDKCIQLDVLFLPNYYPIVTIKKKHHSHSKHIINIGCFGAIRPLKNQLEQAVAAIIYSKQVGKHLNFHINSSRIEGHGEPVLKALRALFKNTPNTNLIEHGWIDHHSFIHLCATMDIGLQVSFSETFNIVAADLVSIGVPVVGSSEIPWIDDNYIASPTSAMDIAEKMHYAARYGVIEQQESLIKYSKKSQKIWLDWISKK